MPGRDRLARELGVSRKTVEAALGKLERDGLLESRGSGRPRKIAVSPGEGADRSMRVQIMLYGPETWRQDWVLELQHFLLDAGHVVEFPARSLTELGMNVGRVARVVKRTEADAWIVIAGSSEVLQWFADQPVPAFAIGGRLRGVDIPSAGPDKLSAMLEAVRRLVELGHRRVVFLEREERRKPEPGYPERMLLEELEAHEIKTGAYNLPDWKDDADGLGECLDSLFQTTPPTALMIDTPLLFIAAQNHLARRGILAPEHVSLVCTDDDHDCAWCRPTIARIDWDSLAVVRRTVRWVNNVARGREDRRKTFSKASFIEGGTIGPVPR